MQAELHLLQYKFVCYRICPALANKIPKVNTQTDNLAKRTRTVAENG